MTSEVSSVKNRRIVVTQLGGPEHLNIVNDAVPPPGKNQVRIRVLASGVSFADLLMREGRHPERKRPPFTPGWDLVGEVECLGDGADGLDVGETVAALTITGGYTQYINLPVNELVIVPKDVDAVEAVCLVMDYVVAYQMLHRMVDLKAGDSVLIHGAGGGCGTALIQLGRCMSLHMFGTESKSKVEHIRQFGAEPIDYQNEDFVNVVNSHGNVKAVFESVGGKNLMRSYRCLQRGGTVVFYGMTTALRGGRRNWRGTCATIFYLLAAYAKNLIPDGRHVGFYSIQMRKRKYPNDYREDLSTLLRLLGEKKINPIIARRFSLADAADAHRSMIDKTVPGKFVLVNRDLR